MSADETPIAINEQSPIRFQTHKIGGHLLFDGHGLSPYYGLVSVFEPAGKNSGRSRRDSECPS